VIDFKKDQFLYLHQDMKDGLMTMEYKIDTKNTPHPYTDEIKLLIYT
jgi:hypothetical protein